MPSAKTSTWRGRSYEVRAFVLLRELLAGHKELAKRLDQLEASIQKKLSTHDRAIAGILDAIRNFMSPPETKKCSVGFITPKET
ncbi:MAG: hypothetical protein ACKVQA_18790 [Burkholderiales bacterium]